MTNPLITRLRHLTRLSEEDLDRLERACTISRTIAARTDIAPQGDQPHSLHIILEGWAARYKLLPDGSRQIPSLLLPGDVCDMDGLILQRIHSGVCAITTCKVAVLPHAHLKELMDGSPAIRDAFWWLLCVENAILTEWTMSLGRRSAIERTAHLLCELLIRLSTVGSSTDKEYAFPLTQTELGDMLGLSAVHVNRMLQGLRERGTIALKDRWLTIHDQKSLMTLARFDPSYLHLERLSSHFASFHDGTAGVVSSIGAPEPRSAANAS